jgi:hypothetical protein
MKKLLFLLALVTITSFGQTIPMKTNKVSDVVKLAELVSTYKIDRVDSVTKNTELKVYLTNNQEKFSITFFRLADGLYLRSMAGKFTDLFPVWQKLVDPAANAQAISAKGSAFVLKNENGKQKRVRLVQSQGDDWFIQVI